MDSALNRFAETFQRHWLAIVCGLLLVYAGLPVIGALLKAAGLDQAAQVIYQPYKAVCHTYGFRSFYLFGEQAVYTRNEFEAKTGIDTSSAGGLFAARDFQGNPDVGYKIALCQRDLAIYPAMALGGMLFGLMRRRMRAMPWWLFLFIGIAPIGLDGFSQLFSQAPFNLFPPFSWIPYRESVWQLRVLTGALFGFSVAWLVFPMIASTLPSSEQAPARNL